MDADLISLIAQKNNIFDHIFYEMEMYHHTHIKLIEMIAINEGDMSDKQFWINVLLESHAVHLRNLIEFFSNKGEDTIKAKTVLVNIPQLGIHNPDEKMKIISRAISHLTEYRVDSSMDMNKITMEMNKVRIESYPDICNRIGKYLEILADDSAIKEQYMPEFNTMEIQKRYRNLTAIFISSKANE